MTAPLSDLSIVWASTSKTIDITEQVARTIAIDPRPTLDAEISAGTEAPDIAVIGVSFVATATAAHWSSDLDEITDGYLFVFDETLGTAFAQLSHLTALPLDSLTADPARTLRTSLRFVPPDTGPPALHVAPGVSGTRKMVVSPTTGYTLTTVASASTSVDVANDGTITMTMAEGI